MKPAEKRSFVEFLCRHLVGLSVLVRETGGERKEQTEVWTCFVMEVLGRWFLVSAGHCVRRMESILTATNYEVLEWGLYDGWASWSRHSLVPFNFADARRYFVDDDELGLDVGVIEVDPLLQRTLAAGGIEPLTPTTWLNPPETFLRHFMVGQPSELIRRVHEGPRLADCRLGPAMLAVEECPPPESMVKPVPRFYAKVAGPMEFKDGTVLSDLDGMSGGPIFGFHQRPDGQFAYYLVAVQGSWSEKHNVVAAARASWVGHALALAVDSGEPNALAEIFTVPAAPAPPQGP
ncbi:MAG: hypothetical protein JNJ54_04555 [Myxococcaceae bacterium]|nr:hypothetical protein [Myxococcaceae bacterium]